MEPELQPPVDSTLAGNPPEASLQHLQLIGDMVPALLSHLDREGHLLFCNRAALTWFGHEPSDVIGKRLADVLGPRAWSEIEPHFQRALSGETADFEMSLPNVQGENRWLHAIYSPRRDESGQVQGVVVLVTDVTQHRASEEELRARQDRLEAALAGAGAGVFRWDLRTNQLLFDESLNRLMGLPPGQAITRMDQFLAVLHPDDRERVAEACRRCENEAADFSMEYRVVWPDGTVRWIFDRGSTAKDSTGKPLYMTGSCLDITNRHDAEEALRASEARFRAAVGAVTSIVWTNNAFGALEGEQPGWANFTGQTFEEYQGQGWTRAIHPQDTQPTLDAWTAAVAERKPFEFEHRVRRKDGEWRFCAVRAVPVLNQEGSIQEWVGVHTDITEARRAEAALRESEARLKVFVEYAPAALAMFDREMRYVLATQRWRDTYRIADDLTGRSHYEVFPEISERWKEVHRRGLAGEVLRAEEDAFERLDGTIQWIKWEVRPWQSHTGATAGILVASEDISAAVRFKRDLQESEAVLRAVANAAGVGLIMVSQDRRYLFANNTYLQLVGRPGQHVVGLRLADVIPELYPGVETRLNAAFRGERVAYELTMPGAPGGGERYFDVVYEPRVTNTENPYVVIVIVDITQRKLTQQLLERTIAERTGKLRETVQELESFSYSIAHDMRAPLRAMQGFSTILQQQYGASLPDPGKDYLRRIATSANRLDTLIQDVLNYSKIVRAELVLRPVDVGALLREIVESYPNFHASTTQLAIEPPLPIVMANPAALTQVLANILGNAVKFVAPGVTPRIRVRAEARGERVARIWIEDNGIGIPADMADRIFNVFERLHSGTEYEGTGIGLAIVRKAVERMGGAVGVESTPGQGSRFWIDLEKPAQS